MISLLILATEALLLIPLTYQIRLFIYNKKNKYEPKRIRDTFKPHFLQIDLPFNQAEFLEESFFDVEGEVFKEGVSKIGAVSRDVSLISY